MECFMFYSDNEVFYNSKSSYSAGVWSGFVFFGGGISLISERRLKFYLKEWKYGSI